MYKSETTQRYSCICIIGVLLTVFFILPNRCLADRGGWHLSIEPVTLTESSQRAIIGWDGQTQVLCLGTDVSSSSKTTVIEFLPLPSEPNVTLGKRESFEAVEKVLAERFVRFVTRESVLGIGRGAGEAVGEPFHITFHQRLGAHDITVVKVNRPEEFADWIQEKAKALTGDKTFLPNSIRKLIAKYLNEYRCPYFVFDVIDVGPDPQSVEPIIYEFKSPVVFYPLEISSTFHGQTTIDLIVFSKVNINPEPFWRSGFRVSTAGGVNALDMQSVIPRFQELLGERACLQAFRYTGKIRSLSGNITAGWLRDKIVITEGEFVRAKRFAFFSGLSTAVLGGMLAFICLWPMYFATKRQKPRWGLRLLAGFFLGIPLALGLVFGGAYVLGWLGILEYFLQISEPVIFIACLMILGFILFFFQLGLRRRWYLWWLVYAALAIPATFISEPRRFNDLYDLFVGVVHWEWLWNEIDQVFFEYLLVFVLLFLIARCFVWITGPRKRQRSSLSR